MHAVQQARMGSSIGLIQTDAELCVSLFVIAFARLLDRLVHVPCLELASAACCADVPVRELSWMAAR